jgi:3-mercaptopyruvate sulfurtransferase SseA
MRLFISLAIVVVAAFALACNSAERSASSSGVAPASPVQGKSPTTAPADGVRRITTAELKDLLAKGQAVVVDVRNQAAYDTGHIKGARLIPTNETANRAHELPRDKTIVTYCS